MGMSLVSCSSFLQLFKVYEDEMQQRVKLLSSGNLSSSKVEHYLTELKIHVQNYKKVRWYKLQNCALKEHTHVSNRCKILLASLDILAIGPMELPQPL